MLSSGKATMNYDVRISFNTIFESASLGIIVTNEQGKIVLANPFLLQQFGYPEHELIGESVDKLIPSRFHHRHHQHIAHFNEHPKKRPMGLGLDLFGNKKDGSEFPVEVSLGNIEDENGKFTIAFISDISKRKEAENALIRLNDELETIVHQRTESLSNTVKDLAKVVAETQAKDLELGRANSFLKNIWHHAEPIIFVTDENGIIKMFNPTAEKQLGYKAHEVIDRASPLLFYEPQEIAKRAKEQSNLLKKEVKPDFTVLAAKAIQGLSNESELAFIRKDHSSFPVSLTFNVMRDVTGQINGYLGIAIDISERKKAETDLRMALKRERELSELKSRFVSMASHEFRTPLSTVLTSAFILSQYSQHDDSAKKEKHVQRIVTAVKMLNSILDDFLSVGKIEEGKIQVCNSEFDLEETIRGQIAQLSDILKKGQEITYAHQGKKAVVLDPKLLNHIVTNLISNAIKFSNEGSIIEIRSSNLENVLKISVKDQGIGISAKDQAHLFERFFRGSNVNHIQGTGLGLHIIRNYAELMNGSVRCESTIGKGTTFEVVFPLQPHE
ncbi:PAS domain S-box protein [Dyadobacter flavalbus]|uniref:histidine kinase n=1 Tax=Dyadobacter flavalbus TaxID=2579942 RepID=A0A5M8QWW1_9BACT|nr:PAS domain-containing sensor histidine kinase [Dyadobacter flavalbus]KAA6439314.1 PAS domain S-box protein [Dyadobacter flavalbus]